MADITSFLAAEFTEIRAGGGGRSEALRRLPRGSGTRGQKPQRCILKCYAHE